MKHEVTRPLVRRPGGMTILEVVGSLLIIGIAALMVIPRVFDQSQSAKRNTCHVHRENVNIQAQSWFRNNGSWPSNPLAGTMGADSQYFPDGFPTCPVDGTTYQLDPTTHQVIGHDH